MKTVVDKQARTILPPSKQSSAELTLGQAERKQPRMVHGIPTAPSASLGPAGGRRPAGGPSPTKLRTSSGGTRPSPRRRLVCRLVSSPQCSELDGHGGPLARG
jgi:hypothetical protein